jgi:hypothetical protein
MTSIYGVHPPHSTAVTAGGTESVAALPQPDALAAMVWAT